MEFSYYCRCGAFPRDAIRLDCVYGRATEGWRKSDVTSRRRNLAARLLWPTLDINFYCQTVQAIADSAAAAAGGDETYIFVLPFAVRPCRKKPASLKFNIVAQFWVCFQFLLKKNFFTSSL